MVVTMFDTDEGHSTELLNALRAYLTITLGDQANVLTAAEYIPERTAPEGASTLGINELIIVFGSGAGLALVQQAVSLLVEWLKARKHASISIEIDSLKLSVSGISNPEERVLKLLTDLDTLKRKQKLLRQ